jgi:hypothetical protein
MDITDLRYIVFCIDSRYKQHEGVIVGSISEARREAQQLLDEYIGTKMILASFLLDPKNPVMYLNEVEVIDSKTSKKKLDQLDLFK